jgi:hypothetical protein
MQLTIKEIPTQYNFNTISEQFECLHLTAEIRVDYGDWGKEYYVVCSECKGADLDEWVAQDLIDSYLEAR